MITLECNYGKKLGLPGFSSHQFSVTLRAEITDVSQVQSESARLYKLLQDGVDSSIKKTGYLPNPNDNSNLDNNISSGHAQNGEGWKCTEKQKSLILKIVEQSRLDKSQVEALAQERFAAGVKSLSKLQASSLIAALLEQTGSKTMSGRGRFRPVRHGRINATVRSVL